MAESLVDDLYATVGRVEKAQKKTAPSAAGVKTRSQSVEHARIQNRGRCNRYELPVTKDLKSLREKTDTYEQKCERFSKKEKDVSKHSEHTIPHTQDQSSWTRDVSKQGRLSRKEWNISGNSKMDHTSYGNERQKEGERRQNLRPNCSEFHDGWQRVQKHNKERNKRWQSESRHQKDDACLSSVGHKAGDRVQSGAQQSGYHMEGRHNSKGSHGPQAQTGEQEVEGRGRERKCGLGYRQLEKLAGEKPSEIVLVLANRRIGFETLVKQPLSPDLLILVVRILSKLCKADFEENKAAVLSCACVHEFLDQLSKHIAVIPLEVNKVRKDNVGSFLVDLMTFLETVVNLLPSKAVEGFENVFMMTDGTIKIYEGWEPRCSDFDEVKKKFEHVRAQYKICVEEQERKDKNENSNAVAVEVPPDDFRGINVFPDPEDILSDKPGFLRPNIVDGAYVSVDDYLDTQFRLLREDFVGPLREGISQYINMTDKQRMKRINSVRIYRKVSFLSNKITKDQPGLIVCFDPDKRLKNVTWEQSKRFMFGSLLLFSRDNFANIVFATVMGRDLADLKKGNIVVQLSKDSDVSCDLFSDEFVMAESQVYFEPYYHVLKALQNMREESFPMEKYIIHAQVSDDPPKYLRSGGGVLLDIDGHAVYALEDSSWPGPLELKLDDSQFRAFKSALTKEFVVVQGPPGTGKTFLGLKVATVLLKNAQMWHASGVPMLVVCYTNHALDQFLEGLVLVTDRIVRVGGQSKSELLKSMTLKDKRKLHRSKSNFNLSEDIRSRMSYLMSTMKSIQSALEMITNYQGIVSLSALREEGIIQDQHLGCFASQDDWVNEKLFIDWLELGMYDYVPPNEVEENDRQNVVQNIDGNCSKPKDFLEDTDDIRHHMLDNMVDWKLEAVVPNYKLAFALDLEEIESEIKLRDGQIQYWRDKIKEDFSQVNTLHMQEEINADLKLKLKYIRRQLAQKGGVDRRTVERLLQQGSLWQLQAQERWILYRYWVDRLRNVLLEKFRRQEAQFRSEARMYEEVQQMNDLDILRESLIVGMTTTGAARCQSLLQALKAKIVIVEEAAEVLESHIVASLTRHCEHLILIGDHKQLRPSPAVYRLARDFNFDISLFERMVKNRMHCEVLKVQHRMRPEVAELIVPSIYPELTNHSSVLQYETVRGMLKSVFFITHNHPEEEVEESSSRRNTHEGDFLIALCCYLVQQGYSPSRITVLATYSGQMFYLRSVQKQHSMLKEVKITVVDNFQGEENDIILLSLVRSNREAKIGFLKTENRVCVALSRAKMGFYIIGNIENLTRSSKIWPKIKETLQKQDALDTHLTLRCQVHPSVFTRVSSAADFHKVPEGSCLQICGAALPCGHICKIVCHVRDREHKNVRCSEKCERVPERCELQHRCRKLCWEDCGDCLTSVLRTLPCGHSMDLHCYVDPLKHKCPIKVEVELPDCGHKVTKPCHKDVQRAKCSYPCEDRLPCGHSCVLNCHKKDDPDHLEYRCTKPCTRKNAGCKADHVCSKKCYEECGDCMILVERKLPHCEHTGRMPCYVDPETFQCRIKCNRKLPHCEHTGRMPCYVDPETFQCRIKCNRKLPHCEHSGRMPCYVDPETFQCTIKCNRKLPHCEHSGCMPCYVDPETFQCTIKCNRKLPHCEHSGCMPCYVDPETFQCTIKCNRKLPHCEHPAHMPCYMDPETFQCRIRCNRILPCGHPCPSLCYEKCGNCQVQVLKQIEACGHTVRVKCCERLDAKMCMSPCNKLLRCGHKCITVCSAVCTQKCQQLVPSAVRPACGHLVDVPCYMQNQILDPFSEELLSRCQMPCGAILSCDHRCQGTCRQCMQGRIHMACKEKCGKTLICGHSCNIPCAESCPPCNRKCTYTCKHSRCSKNCGQPCVPCKEPCEWSCIHHRCRKLCYELCDREPCNEPCTKPLPCKHPCIGFCGETCPPLCRVCDKDEVTKVFFGTEDEPDARFIYLEDCKHVLEATGLEQWMALTDGEIKIKHCPKCKTPIAKTQRFMNIVKKVYQDVQRVKSRVFYNMREIEASRDELRAKLYELRPKLDFGNHYDRFLIHHIGHLPESAEFRNLYAKLSNEIDELQPVKGKKVNILSPKDTAALRVQIEIFCQVVECCSSTYRHLVGESKAKIVAHMNMLLRVVRQRGKKISGQEIDDMNREIQRFHRLCQLHRLKSEPNYIACCSNPEVKECYETAHQIAYTIKKYSEEFDWKLKNALENLRKVVGSAVQITDAERKEIVRAMGYKQGHWYKCPNGHIYIITECGGAMQQSRCNECGAEIGGGSHRLMESNSVATEMDSATRPALAAVNDSH